MVLIMVLVLVAWFEGHKAGRRLVDVENDVVLGLREVGLVLRNLGIDRYIS